MELSDIKLYDVLRLLDSIPSEDRLFLVTKIEGRNIYLLSPNRLERLFKFMNQFARGSLDDEKVFESDIAKLKIGKPLNSHIPRPESPEKIRALFDKYKDILQSSRGTLESFLAFWGPILDITGDYPGRTWEMRICDYPEGPEYNPVIKIPSLRTGNPVDFMHFFGNAEKDGSALRIEIIREFLSDKFDSLFPLKDTMYKTGKAVVIPYADLNEQTKQQYFECIRELLGKPTTGPDPTAKVAE